MAKQKQTYSNAFSDKLLQWWDVHGRKDLPWQSNKTPYRVWVSEIMLQQTQVASVIDYYQRFMKTFPTLVSLANAHEDQVLEHWAGLGYYARARNLHKTAKLIASELNGEFPSEHDDIVALPGIGRSTAGAIRSIAFKQRAPILDGNVKRVLSRYDAVKTWPGDKQTEAKLWLRAEEFTPQERVADYTQAIMDLGATLCTRSKPQCDRCPMQSNCEAHNLNIQSELPISKPKKQIPLRTTWVIHLQNKQNQMLLEKRPAQGIWGGLYSLPEESTDHSIEDLTQRCAEKWGLEVLSVSEQKGFVHTFSHYKLQIQPVLMQVDTPAHQIKEADNYHWLSDEEIKAVGLPAPIEKYLVNNTQPELPL